MKYEKKKDKYVFNKRGVYFSLTPGQVDDMIISLLEIQKLEHPRLCCVVNCKNDGDEETLDSCVWDEGNIEDCVHACAGVQKDDCEHWKAI